MELPPLTEKIVALLDGAGVPYRFVEHDATRTSEESAAARGEPLEIGGKSLLLKVGPHFALCVLSASARVDANAVRRHLGQSGARFATREELHELTGLVPGCVPPFGEPILALPLLLDEGFLANDRIAFNAASLHHSVIMNTEDWLRIARPQLGRFARP
ncbi:YbaK/EbsC family protein [Engelhardtia mirabilis]|uniref:Prolyl-tRNA editing protein ProX n=1 Tax=Engelhardtia mirabilis TaxID=2528011 RepID=A0A518BJZ1_9BACT|nr:Prolyl-tRNA editing protein ProX [Planctomycetes bacterium Pla133]QDV01589.1 Prolyl-tRNA editing protein ProX [Planctomycetes bacterium Pla86]